MLGIYVYSLKILGRSQIRCPRKLLILQGLQFILPHDFLGEKSQYVAKSLILKDLGGRPPPVGGGGVC